MREILILLDTGGLLLLLASSPHLRGILRSLAPGKIRRSWCWLSGLVAFFVFGYAVMLFSNWMRTPDHFDVLMAAIMFSGGGFVLTVTTLAHWTVDDFRRVASLEQQARLDPLTSLYNRRYLDHCIEDCHCGSVGERLPISFMMFDVDHFKSINDAQGHAFGDAVLRDVAQMIFRKCRVTDLAVRYGGDEFLVVSPNTATDVAARLADQICRLIASSECGVTVSAGLATATTVDADITGVIRQADQALYLAKNNGRNCVEIFKTRPLGLIPSFS